LIAFLENECVTWLDRHDAEFPGIIHRDEPAEQDREEIDVRNRAFAVYLQQSGVIECNLELPLPIRSNASERVQQGSAKSGARQAAHGSGYVRRKL
jgi:hypothetical protein